jgi:tRNA(Arg) A34 adenosine deaminase TadA
MSEVIDIIFMSAAHSLPHNSQRQLQQRHVFVRFDQFKSTTSSWTYYDLIIVNHSASAMVADNELKYLKRCVELAREALEAGDAPFGSVLVDSKGDVLKEDRNRTVTGKDATLHPEFTIAIWAQQNLSPEERATATVYTSGEHCPLCSSAHAWVGLDRIVYVSSSEQLVKWRKDLGTPAGPVAPLAINQVAPGLKVEGPIDGLHQEVFELHKKKRDLIAAKSQ